jgi:hypothetical protein
MVITYLDSWLISQPGGTTNDRYKISDHENKVLGKTKNIFFTALKRKKIFFNGQENVTIN